MSDTEALAALLDEIGLDFWITEEIAFTDPVEYTATFDYAEYAARLIAAGVSLTPAPLDVERLTAFLRRAVRENTDSQSWRNGIGYAIECIENAARLAPAPPDVPVTRLGFSPERIEESLLRLRGPVTDDESIVMAAAQAAADALRGARIARLAPDSAQGERE